MILWRGLMANPLTGHCDAGTDGWCNLEAPFPDRQAVVQPDGMVRLEVRFGDKDPRYSEQRALLTAVNQTTFREGDEVWVSWPTRFPIGYVQKWPKEDELAAWPASFHKPGSIVEWHHAPTADGKYGGDWSKMPGGSAPIYTGIGPEGHYLSLVKSITESVEYKGFSTPMDPGIVNRHVMHVRWSADPAKGLLEYWVNGVSLGGALRVFTLYPDTEVYLAAGTYRRLTIGDPSLTWPADAKVGVDYPVDFVPHKGQRVFPRDDGYPAVLYLGTVLIGTTRADVEPVPAPAPIPPLPLLYNDLRVATMMATINQCKALALRMDALIAAHATQSLQNDAHLAELALLRAAVQKVADDSIATLNKGP